jgi:hypothetical protein
LGDTHEEATRQGMLRAGLSQEQVLHLCEYLSMISPLDEKTNFAEYGSCLCVTWLMRSFSFETFMRRKPVAFREFLEENLPLFDVAYNEYCKFTMCHSSNLHLLLSFVRWL